MSDVTQVSSKELGLWLKEKRERVYPSLVEVSKAVGITPQAISAFEKGRLPQNPLAKNFVAYLRGIRVSLEELATVFPERFSIVIHTLQDFQQAHLAAAIVESNYLTILGNIHPLSVAQAMAIFLGYEPSADIVCIEENKELFFIRRDLKPNIADLVGVDFEGKPRIMRYYGNSKGILSLGERLKIHTHFKLDTKTTHLIGKVVGAMTPQPT